MRMKKVYKEAEIALRKSQEDIKKYVDRKRSEIEEYQVGDYMLLSTKYLKYQMQERQLEKLMKRFVEPYKVKKIILTNTIELELPSSIKIHPVVNISRVHRYKDQVKDQKKEQPVLVVIKGEKEYKVKKILNKRKFREKNKYLVW